MKTKKTIFTLLAVTAVSAATLGLTACGGSSAANMTGNYISNDTISYSNFLPTYNYFTLTSTTQEIETYDDGTYCFSTYETLYSNVSFGADVAAGEETWNDQRMMITRYYGEYTSEEDTDTNTLTITMSVPTRVTYARTGYLTIDTENWTDDMANSIVDYQGAAQTDSDGNAYTAETYLASVVDGMSSTSVIINLSTYKFTQISW